MNISWKVSDGDSGMVTLGPTDEVNGGMVTELSVADQHGRVSELGMGASLGGVGGWSVTLSHTHPPGHRTHRHFLASLAHQPKLLYSSKPSPISHFELCITVIYVLRYHTCSNIGAL